MKSIRRWLVIMFIKVISMNSLLTMNEFTRIMIERYQDQKMNALDMTLGKGNDSLYLSKYFKHVYSFDVQQQAIDCSKELLSYQTNVTLIKDNHVNFNDYVKEDIKLVIYNLGYLPGHDKNITTTYQTTLKSLELALTYLSSGGIIILSVYIEHETGLEESKYLEKFIDDLDKSHYRVARYQMVNVKLAPYVLLIHKK